MDPVILKCSPYIFIYNLDNYVRKDLKQFTFFKFYFVLFSNI